MRLRDVQELRGKVIHAMRELTEHPAGDGGDLSQEQAQRFDQLKGELAGIEKRIERQATIEEAERRMQGQNLTGSGDDRFDAELRNYSLVRAMAGQAGMDVDHGREKECSSELARRMGIRPQGLLVPLSVFMERRENLTTTTPAAGPGSNIIAVDHLGNQFIDRLRAALVIRQLGARVLNSLVGDVDIPRLKASTTSYWVAEDNALTASNPQFDKVQLSPKHAGCLTEISRNMLLQTSPDIESLVRDDFAKVLAAAVDSVAIKGGGSNEPTGILETSGVNEVDVSDGWSWAKVLAFIEAVESDNATGGAWATTPAVVKMLRSTPKATAVYIAEGPAEPVSGDFIMDWPNSLAGYRLASTSLVPTGQAVFGNWSDLLIGYWSAFDLLVNPYEALAYKKGNVQVRGMLTMDIAVRHPESFCIADLIGS